MFPPVPPCHLLISPGLTDLGWRGQLVTIFCPRKGTVMKLLVDISRVTFTVTKAVAEKTDQNGVQKKDRNTGEPLWTTQVMALDETGGDMLTITTAGVPPKVNVGQTVHRFVRTRR